LKTASGLPLPRNGCNHTSLRFGGFLQNTQ
jgi:hypothetical protein